MPSTPSPASPPTAVLAVVRRTMKHIAAACLLSMSLVTCADVVGRLFGHPIFGSEEIVTFLAVLVVGFALPYAHHQRSHIGIDLFVEKLSSPVRRWLSCSIEAVAAGLFGVTAWQLFIYGRDLQVTGRMSMNLGLPEHYVIYALAVGFVVFTLHLAVDAAARAAGRKERV